MDSQASGHGFYGSVAKRSLRQQCKNCRKIYSQTKGGGILKTNEPILMPGGTSGPWEMSMKWSTLGVRRSKVKVTRGRSTPESSRFSSYCLQGIGFFCCKSQVKQVIFFDYDAFNCMAFIYVTRLCTCYIKLGLLYRKAARWMRKPVGRRRRMPADDDNDNDDDDVEDDDDGQQWKSKKPKKRKNGSKEFVSPLFTVLY